MVLNETNISMTAYCWNRLGYKVPCLTARMMISGGAEGGIRLVTRERPIGLGIYSTRYHTQNMVSYEIFNGLIHTPLVDAYLPPSTLEHLLDMEKSLKHFKDPIVL